jgi:predicted short-subunit dehydrogenase-like oxidoreductase (DUF2520 family)
MTVSEFRAVLGKIQHLCASAGAKTAAKELQSFSDMLKPYADMQFAKACADIKHHLSQATVRPVKRGKATPDQDVIQRHLTELHDAGSDQQAFDLMFKKLKASKSLKLQDLSEIARRFSLSVTAYKSKAAAYSDIEKSFVRQARFENKLK